MSQDVAAAEHRRLAPDHPRSEAEARGSPPALPGHRQEFEVGDVIVSPIVRFDCTASSRSSHSRRHIRKCARNRPLRQGQGAVKANSAHCQGQYRQPKIVSSTRRSEILRAHHRFFLRPSILDNHFSCRDWATSPEMGRRILRSGPPGDGGQRAALSRHPQNVSDPQVKADGNDPASRPR